MVLLKKIGFVLCLSTIGGLCGFAIAMFVDPFCIYFEALWQRDTLNLGARLLSEYVMLVALFGAAIGAILFPIAYGIFLRRLNREDKRRATLQTFFGTLAVGLVASPCMEFFTMVAILLGFLAIIYWRSNRYRQNELMGHPAGNQ